MVTQVDDDFAAFVRSRQRALLRAADLVCGDGAQAEDVVQEAFAKLASRWTNVRDGSPDAYVRRIVYRDAVSGWRRWGRWQAATDPASYYPDLGDATGCEAVGLVPGPGEVRFAHWEVDGTTFYVRGRVVEGTWRIDAYEMRADEAELLSLPFGLQIGMVTTEALDRMPDAEERRDPLLPDEPAWFVQDDVHVFPDGLWRATREPVARTARSRPSSSAPCTASRRRCSSILLPRGRRISRGGGACGPDPHVRGGRRGPLGLGRRLRRSTAGGAPLRRGAEDRRHDRPSLDPRGRRQVRSIPILRTAGGR